jgi:ankyrin repeat protein
MVKLLLDMDGVDLNSKNSKYDRSPLSRAAKNGHETMVKILLGKNSVDANSKDTLTNRTPL